MSTMISVSDQEVRYTMRAILHNQVTLSWMNKRTTKYIFDNGLIRHVEWPAWCMVLTETGAEFLHRSESHE